MGHGGCLIVGRLQKNEYIWWRDITKVNGEMYNDQWFEENVRRKVGNGFKINFWNDRWLGQTTLIKKLPKVIPCIYCKRG